MKNKKATYLLLAAALLIWGYIVYSVVDFKSSNTVPKSIISLSEKKNDLLFNEVDTFSLWLNYDDPFLHNSAYSPSRFQNSNQSRNVASVKVKPVTNIKPTETVKWPLIVFNGTITSSKENKLLCLLKVEGTDYVLPVGKQAGEIDIVSITTDSITVALKGQKKTVLRNK